MTNGHNFFGLAIVVEDTKDAQRCYDAAVRERAPLVSAPVRVHIDGVIKDFTYAEFKRALGFDMDAAPNDYLQWGRELHRIEDEA